MTNFWLKWFPQRYLNSKKVQKLSLEEEGAYRRLLDKCWILNGIPKEISEIQDLIGKRCSKKIVLKILPFFIQHPDNENEYHHTVLLDCLVEADYLHNQAVEKGKKSGQVRREKLSRGLNPAHSPTQPEIELGSISVRTQDQRDSISITNYSPPPPRARSDIDSRNSEDVKKTNETFFRDVEKIVKICEEKKIDHDQLKSHFKKFISFKFNLKKIWKSQDDFEENFLNWLPSELNHEPKSNRKAEQRNAIPTGKLNSKIGRIPKDRLAALAKSRGAKGFDER